MNVKTICLGTHLPLNIDQSLLIIKEGTTDLIDLEPASIEMDRATGERIIAFHQKWGIDIPVDFEHSTESRARMGLDAPAVGWIKSFHYVDGEGLFANIEWNESTKQLINDKQYKYFSPVINFAGEEGEEEIIAISSLALTNQPRMTHIGLLAASKAFTEQLQELNMKKIKAQADLEAPAETVAEVSNPVAGLIEALQTAGHDIPAEASVEDAVAMAAEVIMAMVEEDTAEGDTPAAPPVPASVLNALGAKSDEEAVILLKQKFVSREDYELLSKKIQVVEAQELERKINNKIDDYVKENKLLSADAPSMNAAKVMATKDFEGWVTFMDAQPSYMPTGRITPKNGETPKVGRQGIINSFVEEFKLDKDKYVGVSISAFVNQELSDARMQLLSAAEKKNLKEIGV